MYAPGEMPDVELTPEIQRAFMPAPKSRAVDWSGEPRRNFAAAKKIGEVDHILAGWTQKANKAVSDGLLTRAAATQKIVDIAALADTRKGEIKPRTKDERIRQDEPCR
jgi:hypothetical protein